MIFMKFGTNLCQMSLLTFERSKLKFKVKSSVITVHQMWLLNRYRTTRYNSGTKMWILTNYRRSRIQLS